MPLLGCVALALAQTSCAAPTRDAAMRGEAEVAMAAARQTVLAGDGPAVTVSEDDVRLMSAALQAALGDHEFIRASGAPEELLPQLDGTFSPGEITRAGQVRAGEWLLVSTPTGPRWDLRLVTPDAPRVGLIFQAPLARTAHGWRATSMRFVRVR